MSPKTVSYSDELAPDELRLNHGEEILRELTPPQSVPACTDWRRGLSVRAERERDHAHAASSPSKALGARGYAHKLLSRGIPRSRVEAIRVSEEQHGGLIASRPEELDEGDVPRSCTSRTTPSVDGMWCVRI